MNYYPLPGSERQITKPQPIKKRSRRTKPEFAPLIPSDVVINVVCDHFNTPFQVLNTHSRKGRLPYIRQIVFCLLREFSLPSLKRVGEMFDRDHTTVMHGIATMHDLIYTDERVYREFETVKAKVLSAA